ncbi:MAG: class I SAM-dependent methyltransferase [Candidatus Eisenbacteria bacterium]
MTTPAEEARRIVVDGYALASHEYRGDVFPLAGSRYAHWLARFAAGLAPGARVLDAGCGNGLPVALELARRFDVTGVDLSPVQVERARALVPGARFVCADMTCVEFPDASFDGVAAFYSLINVPLAEQPGLLARFARWLVPGGRLVATVGQEPWSGVESNWRGVAGARMFYEHAGIEQYREWFAAAGFRIEEQGREPRDGVPGYAMIVARRVPA